ncbi:hypothetical protein SDC9_212050 [bioreactor metagenome]|uniref:Uncharacterized protein n=1 Tax=bioreactor metagenome TaxID=1076179 RepID=A0A645JNE1_9ZZZZ
MFLDVTLYSIHDTALLGNMHIQSSLCLLVQFLLQPRKDPDQLFIFGGFHHIILYLVSQTLLSVFKLPKRTEKNHLNTQSVLMDVFRNLNTGHFWHDDV